MVSNSLTNPCLVVSLSIKRPIVTWKDFQFMVRKLMSRPKISCRLLHIHKSNLIIVLGVESRWNGTKKFEQWIITNGKIYLDNVLGEGKTNLGLTFNANLTIHKGKNLKMWTTPNPPKLFLNVITPICTCDKLLKEITWLFTCHSWDEGNSML
jgi:hypothetical protein